MQPLESAGSFEWLMYYLAQPDFQQWQNWALLRTLAQTDSKPGENLTEKRLKNIGDHLSPEALERWEVPPKVISAEVRVSPLLTLLTAVDLGRHQQLNPTGSLVFINLDDFNRSDDNDLKGDWQAALRLLNFYQFLPHVYALTGTDIDGRKTPDFPRITAANFSNKARDFGQNNHQNNPQWEELKELVLEDDLLPALDRMNREGWPVPEPGYELENEKGAGIAIAELAWTDAKIAVTLTPEDGEAFLNAGWKVLQVEDFLSSLDTLGKTLKE
ncbi:hypothetical protein ACL6C3_14295 [Capilliphycus salinus ALCB114379]|uniref:hypothetical protein n=1 Tax=Capilliphycus salinus TaxID=2768948 RepID=UPI0039A40B01